MEDFRGEEVERRSSSKKKGVSHSFRKPNASEGTPKFENQMLEFYNEHQSRRKSEIKLDSIAKQVRWPEAEGKN